MIAELVAMHRQQGDDVSEPPVARALELARQHLGSESVARGCRHDPPGRSSTSEVEPLRVLAEDIEHAGALRLAATLLDGVQAIAGLDPLDRGRIAAHRARIARKLQDVEGAADRYVELQALADEHDDDELRARVLLGRAAIAQVSGNYPETERLATECIAVANRRGFLRLAAAARVGLVSCAAHRGDYDAALRHAWTSIGALRDDPIAEAEYAANLGRLLLDMGQFAAARGSFARAATMTNAAHVALLALGGLALASAGENDTRTVRWAVRQVLAGDGRHNSPYEYAGALYECAEALAKIGQVEEASSLRDRASSLAARSGFHELRYRAEELVIETPPPPARRPIQEESQAILNMLVHSAPSELPELVVSLSSSD